MALPYVSPSKMEEYRQKLLLFAKGANHLECIRSHYLPDRTGVCDLTGSREQEELFVLENRYRGTMKVSAAAMQIVANIIDIKGADQWYQHLKEQRKGDKERRELEAKQREEKKNSSRVVLLRKNVATTFPGNKT